MALPWRKEYRRRTAIVTLLWNSVHVVTGPSVVYYVIFAREDLGLSPAVVGDIVFYGYFGGTVGHFVAAWLIERIGRKRTCSAFYVSASLSIFMLYQHTTLFGQYFWMVATVFCFAAANTATHVYASELFPTEIRATGYAWTTNLTGRVTEVVTPAAIGFLIYWLGISWSIAVVAIGPVLGAALVMRYAPETRGLTLEEIQEQLSANFGSGRLLSFGGSGSRRRWNQDGDERTEDQGAQTADDVGSVRAHVLEQPPRRDLGANAADADSDHRE